jgi:pimeloyl-ACP methyl ester carboxylesterase
MGGMVAAAYATRFPAYVRHLTLVSPCGVPRPPGHVDGAPAHFELSLYGLIRW